MPRKTKATNLPDVVLHIVVSGTEYVELLRYRSHLEERANGRVTWRNAIMAAVRETHRR
jgi:hypothetical protein